MECFSHQETLLQRMKRLKRRNIMRPYGLSDMPSSHMISGNMATLPSSSSSYLLTREGNVSNQNNIVVEFEGDNVSEICLHLCLDPIIQKQCDMYNADNYRDSGVTVIFFDLERRIKPIQIQKMIESRVNILAPSDVDKEKFDRIVYSVSSRFLIYHMRSALHLLNTLHSLESTLFRNPDVDVNCMIIENLAALHFLMMPTEPLSGGLSSSIPRTIRKLQAHYQFSVFANKPNVQSFKSGASNDYLSKTWKDMVTHRVSVIDASIPNTFDAQVYSIQQQSISYNSNQTKDSCFSFMIVPERGAIII